MDEREIRADERARCLAILKEIEDDADFGYDGEQFGAVYGATRIRVRLGGEPCPDCGGTGRPYPSQDDVNECETCLVVASAPDVLFYGGPLSNFVGVPFEVVPARAGHPAPVRYKTVEHFFQAYKARDRLTHDWIRSADDPQSAKDRGRSCHLRDDWEAIKDEVMLTGLRAKFRHPAYRNYLLKTGERPIVEDSPTDYVWGIGADGTGENRLGKLLVQVRTEIRAELRAAAAK